MDFFEALIPLMGILGTFLSLTIILYTYFNNRTKERLALIAKDKDASIWHKKKRSGRGSMKFAILLIAFGAGTFVGILLDEMGLISTELAILGIVPMFMGAGLLIHNLMVVERYHEDGEV